MSLIKLCRNASKLRVINYQPQNKNIHIIVPLNAVKKLTTAKGQKAMAAAGSVQRQFLNVETDPKLLTTFVCGANVYKEGNDPELKADSEYPDWLWNLRVERGSTPIEEIDPDSQRFWDRKQKEERKRIMVLMKSRRKFREFG